MSENNPTVHERLLQARGREIKEARIAAGWSQAELAERAETTQQTVDRIERGVTGNSKAFPKIREVLGFAPLPGPALKELDPEAPARSQADRHKLVEDSYKRFIDETDRNLKIEEGTHIPVYAMSSEDITQLVSDRFADAIPRVYPVQNVKAAYGIISRDYRMEPVVRPGDIVIVNPNLPVMPETEVVLSRKDGDNFFVKIRSLIAENEFSWSLGCPNASFETLDKSEWPKAELIVAKISRVR